LNIKNRRYTSFVYLTKGQGGCTFEGGSFDIPEGGIAYFPRTSKHVFTLLGDEIEFFLINFTVRVQGEEVLFSNFPQLIGETVVPECAEAICSLEKSCIAVSDTIWKTAKICTILSSLQRNLQKTHSSRLAPAIHYLQQNLSQRVNCHHLASLCYISTTQFYVLFHEHMGMTPLSYRNKLLLDRAVMLLKLGDISINEIAEMLGFEDPAYFSRFFKKYTGCSPIQYLKKDREKREL